MKRRPMSIRSLCPPGPAGGERARSPSLYGIAASLGFLRGTNLRPQWFSGNPACHRSGAKLSRVSTPSGSGPPGIATEDPVFQPRPVPAAPFVERIRSAAGRRTLGLGLAILIETLVLLLLLTLGREHVPGAKDD